MSFELLQIEWIKRSNLKRDRKSSFKPPFLSASICNYYNIDLGTANQKSVILILDKYHKYLI